MTVFNLQKSHSLIFDLKTYAGKNSAMHELDMHEFQSVSLSDRAHYLRAVLRFLQA